MSEHDEQCKLFQWAAHRYGVYPELELMYAIPNGGHRVKAVAVKMKAEGVKSGVPDICLPVARGAYHALYIELKHGKNKTTANQSHWISLLTFYGNLAVVAYEFEGARAVILEYIVMGANG